MKVAIVEDEPLAAGQLKKLIQSYDPEIEILPTVDTVSEAIDLFSSEQPDLIFLDIELSDGISFEIFKEVEVHAPIIFTTAYDHYAIKAFDVNSIDYILKPVNDEKLTAAFSNYDKMKSAFDFDKMNKVIQEVGMKSYKQNFLVKYGQKLLPIETNNISHFSADDKWVYLITQTNDRYLINFKLSQLEELVDPMLFFRLNRKFLINRKSIISLYPHHKGQVKVELTFEKELQVVSRKQTPPFKEWLSQ